jgi:uncharacterized low-complexity protein
MKSYAKTPLAIALGASLLPLAANAAEANPFALTELNAGYLLTAEAKTDQAADKAKDGACGEGKCGAAMMKKADASTEKKAVEGKCAAAKPAAPAGAKPETK